MTAAAATSQRSIGVGRVLLFSAVLGTVGGLGLAYRRSTPPPMERTAQQLAEQVLPYPASPAAAQPADAMEPHPLSLRGIPPYPGAEPRKMFGPRPGGEHLFVVSWFSTQDSVDAVLSFYERAFADVNLRATSHRYSERRGYVSWLEPPAGENGPPEPGEGVLHMVTATREGSQTIVLLSATEPRKMLHSLTPLPAGVQLPPGAVPQVINTSEFGQQRATIYASYELPVDQLEAHLEQTWKAAGWKVAAGDRSPQRVTLAAEDSRRQFVASIEAQGGRSQLVIMLEEKPFERESAP